MPRRAQEEQLLRHHARQDGQGRLPARRRYLLHGRHGPSRAAAHQDQARQQDRLFLLHHGPSRRFRRERSARHGRLRHQHQAQRGRARRDLQGDRFLRQDLRR